MKRIVTVIIVSLTVIGVSPLLFAESSDGVTVEWRDVRKFVDIRTDRGSQQRFEERVFRELGGHLRLEAEKLLGQGQRLVVTVHNLDLAGEVRMNALGQGNFARVIDEPSLVWMEVEYKLFDNQGSAVLHGRDTMRGQRPRGLGMYSRNIRSFDIEKEMISEWVASSLKQQIDGVK